MLSLGKFVHFLTSSTIVMITEYLYLAQVHLLGSKPKCLAACKTPPCKCSINPKNIAFAILSKKLIIFIPIAPYFPMFFNKFCLAVTKIETRGSSYRARLMLFSRL